MEIVINVTSKPYVGVNNDLLPMHVNRITIIK